MTKYLIILLFCFLIPLCTSSLGDAMIGPGSWLAIHIQKCPDNEKYRLRLDIDRRKVNRTHDGFSGWLDMDMDFDESLGVRVDVCKYVDGGCKPYTVMADPSCCHFIEQYAKDNVEKCLTGSGIPLPICPLAKGKYEIASYSFNYEELPAQGIYGLFGAKLYVLQDEVEVGCVDMTVRFDSNESEHD